MEAIGVAFTVLDKLVQLGVGEGQITSRGLRHIIL